MSELRNLLLGRALSRPRGRGAFEHAPHVERVVNLLHGDARDEDTRDRRRDRGSPPATAARALRGWACGSCRARFARHDFGQRSARAVSSVDDAGLEIAIGALDVRRVDGAAAGAGLPMPPEPACPASIQHRIQPVAIRLRVILCRPFPAGSGPSRFVSIRPSGARTISCARVCLRLCVSPRRSHRRESARQRGTAPADSGTRATGETYHVEFSRHALESDAEHPDHQRVHQRHHRRATIDFVKTLGIESNCSRS